LNFGGLYLEGFDLTPREECGIFGIYGGGFLPPAEAVYLGLFALQHRGEESCGIAVSNKGVISSYKNMGLVGDVFNEERIASLKGQIAIGHVRYSTTGSSSLENSQPLVFRYIKGRFAIAHNGNLTNAPEIQDELAHNGAMFQTTTDSEVIAHIIAQERAFEPNIEEAVKKTMKRIKGAYSLLLMGPTKLVAARDPFGFRPLVIGEVNGAYVVASESCALDAVHAKFIRDVEPGEIIVIDADGLRSIKDNCTGKRNICIFEYIYFARPDSTLDGISVHGSRLKAGAMLARQKPVAADVVIGVPDSGLDAAIGYSRESGIEYALGFVRNKYVGRTFIKPVQSQRSESVDIKLTPMTQSIKGKRVIVVDDSIVRGSTSANIIRSLKAAGAAEVHMRISSPTVHWPCYFGIDIPTKKELTSNRNSVDELCEKIGADSLDFLRSESLCELVDSTSKIYCDACFTGLYPYAVKRKRK
jgi:amidophosphoribosyltransferase